MYRILSDLQHMESPYKVLVFFLAFVPMYFLFFIRIVFKLLYVIVEFIYFITCVFQFE
jgi:hypothetical protein